MRKLPIIPIGNEPHHRKKNPNVSSGMSFKTENRKMCQLKSQPKLTSKYKESTTSSQDFALNWVSTEVYYNATIDDKPTKEELKFI